MNESEFIRQQQAAVERMREINSRSMYRGDNHSMPPVPPFVKVPSSEQRTNNNYGVHSNRNGRPDRYNNAPRQPERNNQPDNHDKKENETPKESSEPIKDNSFFAGLNLPFLDLFKKDGDMTLIIGLLLILLSEKADKKLLFALIYILM